MRARHPERRRELAAVDDRRAAAVAVEDPRQRRRQPMAQEDDAVGLAPVQHLRILLLAVAFVAGIAQQHGIARPLRRFLHPANDVGNERVGDIWNVATYAPRDRRERGGALRWDAKWDEVMDGVV